MERANIATLRMNFKPILHAILMTITIVLGVLLGLIIATALHALRMYL